MTFRRRKISFTMTQFTCEPLLVGKKALWHFRWLGHIPVQEELDDPMAVPGAAVVFGGILLPRIQPHDKLLCRIHEMQRSILSGGIGSLLNLAGGVQCRCLLMQEMSPWQARMAQEPAAGRLLRRCAGCLAKR